MELMAFSAAYCGDLIFVRGGKDLPVYFLPTVSLVVPPVRDGDTPLSNKYVAGIVSKERPMVRNEVGSYQYQVRYTYQVRYHVSYRYLP
jgi:hypothetical protein